MSKYKQSTEPKTRHESHIELERYTVKYKPVQASNMTFQGSRRKAREIRSKDHGGKQVTCISKRYLNPSKLEKLLNMKFPGEDYHVELRHDQFKIVASRKLLPVEIDNCT